MKRKQSVHFKTSLADTLIDLMDKSAYSDITICEICAAANVGRATFYRHFQNKDDLLVFKFNHLTEEWAESVGNLRQMSGQERVSAYLEFIYDNRAYISLLSRAGKVDILERYLLGLIVRDGGSVYDAYIQIASAYFFLGIICRWIERDFTDTPEDIRNILLRAVENGFENRPTSQ